ncbi:MAG TPA: hypothetical protein VF603_16260 [Allosphingosinicella sp.]|jgi:hypothetical protein
MFGHQAYIQDGEGSQDACDARAWLPLFDLVDPKATDASAFGKFRLVPPTGSASAANEFAEIGHGSKRGTGHVSDRFLFGL